MGLPSSTPSLATFPLSPTHYALKQYPNSIHAFSQTHRAPACLSNLNAWFPFSEIPFASDFSPSRSNSTIPSAEKPRVAPRIEAGPLPGRNWAGGARSLPGSVSGGPLHARSPAPSEDGSKHSQFLDEETETQRGQVTHRRDHRLRSGQSQDLKS